FQREDPGDLPARCGLCFENQLPRAVEAQIGRLTHTVVLAERRAFPQEAPDLLVGEDEAGNALATGAAHGDAGPEMEAYGKVSLRRAIGDELILSHQRRALGQQG